MKIISLHSKKLLRIATVSCTTTGLQTKVNIQLCEVKRISKKISSNNLAKAIAIKNLMQETFYFQDSTRAGDSELEDFCVAQLKKMTRKLAFKTQVVAINLRNNMEQLSKGIEYLEPTLIAAALDCVVISDFEDGDLSVGGTAVPLSAAFAGAIHPFDQASSLHFLSLEPASIRFNERHQPTAHVSSPIHLLVEKMIQIGEPQRGIASQEIAMELLKKASETGINQELLQQAEQRMSSLSENDRAATLKELASLWVKKISCDDLRNSPKSGVVLFGDDNLVHLLTKRLRFLNPNCRIVGGDELNWPDDTYIGGTLAVLGALKIWGIPSNIPKLTKAKRPVSLGKIIEL